MYKLRALSAGCGALRVFVSGHSVAGFDNESTTDNLSFGSANADFPRPGNSRRSCY